MNIDKNSHIPILDNLRAIAALSVCFFHFVCGPVGFISNKNVLHIFSFGSYGVQLFFVISGFIIPWSISRYNYKIGNYLKFLLKRFLRLEPPYLVSIVLVIAFFYLRKMYVDVPDIRLLSPKQLLLHIGYLIPFTEYTWVNKVYWTLAIEFQFYLFMGLFYFVIVSKDIKVRILGYIAVLGLSFVGSEKFLPFWLPVFLIGNMLFLFMTERITIYEFYSVLLLIFIQIGLFLPTPAIFSSAIPTICILFFYNYSNRFLSWIGKISYSIYLIHTIVGFAVINVLSHHAHTVASKIFVILIGLSISIVCSYVMYLIVEKPSKKLSSKIKL